MNIFEEQPEFIQLDPRKNRPRGYGYAVTPDFMQARHQALLDPSLLLGKRVLDLGSCLAATGAWCLSNGASFYQGIEIDDSFIKNSIFCLGKYYSPQFWSISKSSIEDFLANHGEKFDVLIASGVLHGAGDPLALLASFTTISELIVIENTQYKTIFDSRILSQQTLKAIASDPRAVEFLETESYISVGQGNMTVSGNKTIQFAGFNPSMGAVKFIMDQLGYECNDQPYLKLKKALPSEYAPHKRYALHFRKDLKMKIRKFGLKSAVEDSQNILNVVDWKFK